MCRFLVPGPYSPTSTAAISGLRLFRDFRQASLPTATTRVRRHSASIRSAAGAGGDRADETYAAGQEDEESRDGGDLDLVEWSTEEVLTLELFFVRRPWEGQKGSDGWPHRKYFR